MGNTLVRPVIRGIQAKGVMATVKHFVANSQETDRHIISSVIDERTLHEIYYPPFEGATRAGAAVAMCSCRFCLTDSTTFLCKYKCARTPVHMFTRITFIRTLRSLIH